MISSDIGSLPARIPTDTINSGARKANGLLPHLGISNQDHTAFKDEVVSTFKDKLKRGIEAPNYPQFRDMNTMFFELMTGYEKHGGAYYKVDTLRAKNGAAVPETEALRSESRKLRENNSEDTVKIKTCVTGPYTLASFFQTKTPGLYLELGNVLADIFENSIFSNQNARIEHMSLDEPVLGFMNDPLLDYGSDGREALRRSWDKVLGVAKKHGISTSMHLHNTSENLFWDAEHLDMVACHVGDQLYTNESTKRRLEETDKQLFAAIGITQFDNLIQSHYLDQGFTGNMPEKIGETWTDIRRGEVDPYLFLEEPKVLRKRLEAVVETFGVERIGYVSPECGLNSFPEYEAAMECLRRHADVISEFTTD